MKAGNLIILLFIFSFSYSQNHSAQENLTASIKQFHFQLPVDRNSVHYTDLDLDGDPDLLKYITKDSIPVMWIDDDDDMKVDALSGDLDSDCLLMDLNVDGIYGGGQDLIIDWNDENHDGIADMQVILDNGEIDYKGKWASHFICMINTDNKAVFNNIDWNQFKVEGWEKMGRCNFLNNYHGNNLMLKAHISSFDIGRILSSFMIQTRMVILRWPFGWLMNLS